MKPFAAIVIFLLSVFLAAGTAAAAEEIGRFHALLEIREDGTLTVTETITVNVEGREISRGIYRDIPLRFEDAQGLMREARFDVRSVTRNGNAEPFVTERSSGVVRIRIGQALLPHEEHTYRITYDISRQIRFFKDHDELYWNVTGTAWDFPIRRASAEIVLPAGAQATDVTYYTGPYGSTEQAARARRLDGGNRIIVEAARELGRREGLTVVVAISKGIVAPPSAEELRADWWRDNRPWILGSAGIAIVLSFYFWAWRRVGRDPPGEIVVPRWTPPDGISPALANYIERRGFRGAGWDAFAASLVDLAVKGHLVIEQPGKTMTIRRRGSGIPGDIGIGQRAILNALPREGDALTLNKSGGSRIEAMGRAFRRAMEKEHRGQFYRGNAPYVAVGLVVSAALLLLIFRSGGSTPDMIGAMLGTIVPAAAIATVAANVGRRFRSAHSLGARIAAVIGAAFAGFVGLSIAAGSALMILQNRFDLRILAVLAGLVIINLAFYFIMGAPTPVGQKRSAEIAGLKQYLTLAEQERLNMQGAPEMSPRHFETLLPYAIALGVEKPWSRAFDAWLATALATGATAYAGPSWYRGSDFSPGKIGSGMGDLAKSLSRSLTASLPAPKSSSSGFSGGGGYSGGGGGGGGGGGW